jgi:RNA polymerase-binding transcription factor DksA
MRVSRARLAFFEEALRRSEADLLGALRELQEESDPLASRRDFRSEGESYAIERARRSSEAQLVAVRAALERVHGRAYGICADCGNAIDERRLKLIPEATLCMSCQWKAEGARSMRSSDRRN